MIKITLACDIYVIIFYWNVMEKYRKDISVKRILMSYQFKFRMSIKFNNENKFIT